MIAVLDSAMHIDRRWLPGQAGNDLRSYRRSVVCIDVVPGGSERLLPLLDELAFARWGRKDKLIELAVKEFLIAVAQPCISEEHIDCRDHFSFGHCETLAPRVPSPFT